MSQHHATFTWGAGPQTVHISGGFNSWSDKASPLQKQADGTFKGEVALPWGEKQAFKYVVDGEWKVREDEAKEWDAAGNMNNVYTAPPAPAAEHKTEPPHAAPAALAAAPVAAAAAVAPKRESSPVSRAPEPAPVPAIAKAEPTNLMAASAPAPASSGSMPRLGDLGLGAPISAHSAATSKAVAEVESKPISASTAAPSTSHVAPMSTAPSAPPAVALPPTPAAPATTTQTVTPAEAIEKTAARANVGEATAPHEETYLEKASHLGATALAGIGAYVGAAAVAVEKATGVDLTHGQPLTIAEAKAAGVDVNTIQKRDGETDTVSPVNTKPPSAAVDDLARKVEDLKVGSASTAPKPEHHSNDLPAQNETTDNHKKVPMPVITAVSEKDPKKDRTLEGAALNGSSAAKPIGADPSISAKAAKVEAETNPGKTGATTAQVNGTSASSPVTGPAATGPIAAGGAAVSPNTKSVNPTAPAPPKKDTSGIHTAPTTSAGQAPEPPHAATPAPIPVPAPVAAVAPAPAAAAPAASKPTPVVAPPASKPTPVVAPATPTKATTTNAQTGTPTSIQTTPATTPVKAAHGKEATSGSDVRKRKSSIFHKIKSAFSPKDKEKK